MVLKKVIYVGVIGALTFVWSASATSPDMNQPGENRNKNKNSSVVWLDDLDVSLSRCGWQKTLRRRSVGGNPLKLGGVTYDRGIGTHGDGEFRIRLKKGTRRFTAKVGIDDEAEKRGSVEFIVKGDRKVLWRSGIIRGGDAPESVDLNLAGVDILQLIVTTGEDNFIWDHADWALAKFEVSGPAPKAVPVVPEELFSKSVGTASVEPADVHSLEEDWQSQYNEVKSIKPDKYRFPVDQVFNRHAIKWGSDKSPADTAIRRLEALIAQLKRMENAPDMREAEARLARLKVGTSIPDRYLKIRKLARQVVLSNPHFDFDSILFVSRGVLNDHARRKVEYDGDHFCDQFYGHNGRKGGGLFILKNWKSEKARVIDVVKGLRVPSGTNRGQLLSEGTFLSPDLSWDGRTILFAWSCGGTKKWAPENRFSIFRVNVDGTGLARLTDTPYDDFDPAWLPNGRIVFISSMRHGFGRCHGRPVPVFTLFSMNADGSDRYPIDYHETNEFQPSVDNRGMLVYTRWDYVDRDHSAAHHMWHCAPDGRDPRSYHGNYAFPLDTLSGRNFVAGQHLRPWAEFNCRAVPGSDKFIATAGPHHGQAFGSLVMIDIKVPDDYKMSQVKRITPDYLFPESETGRREWRDMAFGTAWPFDENFYLCNYQDKLCILDAFGNREMICRLTNGMRPVDPIPVRARKRPPVIPCKTNQGVKRSSTAPLATVGVMNVYVGDKYGKLPEGTEIKEMRVIQLIPKSTYFSDSPRIGYGSQSLARIPLGVVPVEKDGSVYFRAPVEKALYFQLLDKNGMAVKSMRSATYVHPGEQLSCLGCHEDKYENSSLDTMPIAMRRAPSDLKPEITDPVMFNFNRHVKPILNKSCVGCHQSVKEGKSGPKNMEYRALRPYAFYLGHGYRSPLSGGSRTAPGRFGASFSRMGRALMNPTHQKLLAEGKVTREEMRTIFMWLDLNSNEFSDYQNPEKQRKGEIVWPMYDVDPDNYTGVELREP